MIPATGKDVPATAQGGVFGSAVGVGNQEERTLANPLNSDTSVAV